MIWELRDQGTGGETALFTLLDIGVNFVFGNILEFVLRGMAPYIFFECAGHKRCAEILLFLWLGGGGLGRRWGYF